MRHPPSIDELRRRKSLNVAQQVEIARDDIRREAAAWRRNPMRHCVREVFTARGIDIEKGIFISVSDRDYGLDFTCGTFVTENGRFIDFDIELSPDGESVVEITDFNDSTEQQDICGRKPGIGATRAFLALEVLHDLNQAPTN